MSSGARVLALTLAVCITALGVARHAVAQDQTAVVEAVPSAKDVSTNKDVRVEIRARDVTNLGAFQIVLSADPNVIEPVSIEKTDFLGSSGREVLCKDPTIDSASILYNCVTLRTTPAGVDGSGTLAIATFHSKGNGTTDLSLSHVKLAHPDGGELPSTSTDGRVTVTSGSGFFSPLTLVVIGVAAVLAIAVLGGGALALSRRAGRARIDRPVGSR